MRGMIDGAWRTGLSKSEVPGDFGDRMVMHPLPGPDFPDEAGRYELFASYACPWAHLTILARTWFGLEDVIGLTTTNPWIDFEHGWFFDEPDPITNSKYLHEVYRKSEPQFTGRVTVPVLWDKLAGRMVQNYSTGILRIFEFGLESLHTRSRPLLDPSRRDEIHEECRGVLENVTYTVYDVGCSKSQKDYDKHIHRLFAALDGYDERLATQDYLLGESVTEADLRLFVTLIRFDIAYYGALYCNLKRIADYPNLSRWLRRMYGQDGFADTVRFDEIRVHYFDDDMYIGRTPLPNGRFIIPAGPAAPFSR